jgi:hypothetical protein
MTLKSWFKFLLIMLLVAAVPALTAFAGDGYDGQGIVGESVLVKGEAFVPTGAGIEKAALERVMPAKMGAEMRLVDKEPLATPRAITANNKKITVKEGWEGIWPHTNWYTWDWNGTDYANYNTYVCWDDENWISHKGGWSAWAAGGCTDGLNPNYDYYVDNMDSWMEYYVDLGPNGAKSGKVTFKYWNNSELGWDYLHWCASVDGYNYYCSNHTGSTGGKWKSGSINLKKVPGYGNMLNNSGVYVAFAFTSDGSISSGYDGAFIDTFKLVATRK